MRLCGISSRFQLLSPCVRQVIHALLTRPPLSHRTIIPEGNQVKCFVRLACVKHAASVHPEPGSNSHKKFFPFQDQLANFNHSSILNVLLFFRLLWLSSLLFSRTHFNANCFAVLNESFKVISLFSYQSSLFVVLATAFIFYQKHLSLSTTFLFFFVVVSSDSLFILSQAFVLVNNFLLFFNSSVILPCTQVFVNNFFSFFITVSGEGGIWTLAPLLTTCTLSRGVPSASLGTSPNKVIYDHRLSR